MIIKKAQQEKYPTYQASITTEVACRDALANIDQSIAVGDVDEFFKSLTFLQTGNPRRDLP